jgi:hypothetical protein
MDSTRDAQQGAGIESGTSSKQKISGDASTLGKPLGSGTGTPPWGKTKTESMPRGHKFKNG